MVADLQWNSPDRNTEMFNCPWQFLMAGQFWKILEEIFQKQ